MSKRPERGWWGKLSIGAGIGALLGSFSVLLFPAARLELVLLIVGLQASWDLRCNAVSDRGGTRMSSGAYRFTACGVPVQYSCGYRKVVLGPLEVPYWYGCEGGP